MIEFTKGYKTSDGIVLGNIFDAQVHELNILLMNLGGGSLNALQVAEYLVKKKDVVIDVLTTTSTSKPKARTIHGGTKKRKTVITDAQPSITSKNLDNFLGDNADGRL